MHIDDHILRGCLREVYFINGTAYAGKSTMVKLLAEKHGMIHCGENYHDRLARAIATPEGQPNLTYFETMSGWQEFIHRTPESYAAWIYGCSEEAAEFEIVELLRLSAQGKKIIADTNLSVDLLRRLSSYDRVALMLSPQSLSVDRFFEREDEDKGFILEQIRAAKDPARAMANYRACIARINSPEHYAAFAESGFFTLRREADGGDTRAQVLSALERHFGLAAA